MSSSHLDATPYTQATCSGRMSDAPQDVQCVQSTGPIPPTPSSFIPSINQIGTPSTAHMAGSLFYDPVQDFRDFADTMGLNSDWSMFEIPQIEDYQESPLSSELVNPGSQSSNQHTIDTPQSVTYTPCPQTNEEIIGVGEDEPSTSPGLSVSRRMTGIKCRVFFNRRLHRYESVSTPM